MVVGNEVMMVDMYADVVDASVVDAVVVVKTVVTAVVVVRPVESKMYTKYKYKIKPTFRAPHLLKRHYNEVIGSQFTFCPIAQILST